jgi:sirohydrochlorin ferrochelatase
VTTTGASAVLLLSHGSRDPRAQYVVGELVSAVAAGTGITVRAAYLDFTAPSPAVALRQLAAEGFTSVRVLPLLCTPGHHLTRDVPKAVAASGIAEMIDVTVAPALVCDDPAGRSLLLRALTARLTQAGRKAAGFDGLVVASAGSSSMHARAVVASLAHDLGATHGIPAVAAFAASAGLRPAQALKALRANGVRRPAVASLFVAPGRLPDAVSASCAGVAVADPLGVTPAFVDLLVAQAQVRSPAAGLLV